MRPVKREVGGEARWRDGNARVAERVEERRVVSGFVDSWRLSYDLAATNTTTTSSIALLAMPMLRATVIRWCSDRAQRVGWATASRSARAKVEDEIGEFAC